MKTYKDILCTEKQIKDIGYTISNNIIESIQLKIIGHFGNVTTMSMVLKDCVLFSGCQLDYTVGDVMRAIVELLDLTNEDGLTVSSIRNIPIRIVSNGPFTKVVGIGNYINDEFIFIDDLIKMSVENVKEMFSTK